MNTTNADIGGVLTVTDGNSGARHVVNVTVAPQEGSYSK